MTLLQVCEFTGNTALEDMNSWLQTKVPKDIIAVLPVPDHCEGQRTTRIMYVVTFYEV